METVTEKEETAEPVAGSALRAVVQEVRESREALGKVERDAVRAARRSGLSWEAIGAAFGVSRQAAHERFSSVDSDGE